MLLPFLKILTINKNLVFGKLKVQENLNSFLQKKFYYLLTPEQEIILQEWMNAFIKMYNITVNYINDRIFIKKKVDLVIASKLCKFRSLRTELKQRRDDLQKSMMRAIYIHPLDEAIKHAVTSFKSCISNFQNGNIRKFRVREMSYKKPRKMLIIEPSFFNNGIIVSTSSWSNSIFKIIEPC